MSDLSGWSPQQHIDEGCALVERSRVEGLASYVVDNLLHAAHVHVALASVKLDVILAERKCSHG